MRFIFCALLCVLLLGGAAGGVQAGDKAGGKAVSFACNPFPPSKIAEGAAKPGSDVEILRAVYGQRGYRVETPFYPWKRAYALARKGTVDGLCSCSYRKEREADFLFSSELGRHSIGVFWRSTDTALPLDNLKNLKHQRVGVVNGYNLERELEQAGVAYSTAADDAQLLGLLRHGRVDAILSYRDPVLFHYGSRADKPVMPYRELRASPYFVCFSRAAGRAEELRREFSLGFQAIAASGELAEIRRRYRW